MGKLRPILFSTDMVRAKLEGRKTQTRRKNGLELVNENPDWYWLSKEQFIDKKGRFNQKFFSAKGNPVLACPYGAPGDILWVRETWTFVGNEASSPRDRNLYHFKASIGKNNFTWKPSIHMPYQASRIFLRIKSVRVERLQSCSGEDAIQEGVQVESRLSKLPKQIQAIAEFKKIWVDINGKGSWDANPWVWVIEFERISKEEALK